MNIRNIKRIIKKIFPRILDDDKIYYIYTLLFQKKEREYIEYNKDWDTDLPIYIIRPRGNGIEGLMSIFLYVIKRIEYAENNNMIPIVDMKNFNSQYYNGINNVWEDFFGQPHNMGIEIAKHNKTNIICGYTWKNKLDTTIGAMDSIFNYEMVANINLKINKWIQLSDTIELLVEKEAKRINPEKCIGVYLRGTDYVVLKPKGEPKQPSAEEVMKKLDLFVQKYNCNRIFLVTEDINIYNDFIKEEKYEVMLLSNDRFISDYKGNDFLAFHDVNINKIDAARDYLIKIILLSRCKYLVSSVTRGSISAIYLNGNKYKDKYIFDLGVY